MDELKEWVRDIPDFPVKGIVFKDITPMLRNPATLKLASDALADAGNVYLAFHYRPGASDAGAGPSPASTRKSQLLQRIHIWLDQQPARWDLPLPALMRTVSTKVAARAPCTVTVVRPPRSVLVSRCPSASPRSPPSSPMRSATTSASRR